jgi:cell division septum initiation protein DivIVA
MSKDDAVASAQKSMIDQNGDPVATDGAGSGTTNERAQSMRAGLAIRGEAEAMLAEASQLRQRAAADADAMVADAEALVNDLVDEAQERAGTVVREAQERADGILARARAEAEELRRNFDAERAQVRAEAMAAAEEEAERLRDLSAGLLSRAESGLRALPPVLDDAVSAVADALATLDAFHQGLPVQSPSPALVRAGAAGPVGLDALPAGPQEVAVPAPSTEPTVQELESVAAEDADGDADARPLGWLFRTTQA